MDCWVEHMLEHIFIVWHFLIFNFEGRTGKFDCTIGRHCCWWKWCRVRTSFLSRLWEATSHSLLIKFNIETFVHSIISKQLNFSRLVHYLFDFFSYKKSGEYYVKVMKKIQEKGDEYVTKELARLQRMLGRMSFCYCHHEFTF